MRKSLLFAPASLAALLVLDGCVTAPTGPSVMVLPGSQKPFEAFRADEADCRQFGLLVQEVSGVTNVEEQRLGPPPDGQAGALITAVMESGQDMALVIDASVLARQLVSGGADAGLDDLTGAEDATPS